MRHTVLIAAYDAGLRTSEGYVARSLLRELDRSLRVILLTRRNNVAELKMTAEFSADHPNVHLVGFDLPRWAAWWKKGARFYGLYAYLWQVVWPLVLRRRAALVSRLAVVHTLNFHNDSIPNTAWTLGRPSIWGPINHNERVQRWRQEFWPRGLGRRNAIKFGLRKWHWRLDPLLRLAVRRTGTIFSAGPWVDARLHINDPARVVHLSQLGVDTRSAGAALGRTCESGPMRLVCPGRLDWIKGLDIAIEALSLLPSDARLTLIGDGPAREMLRELAQKCGVSENVSFVGPMKREELFRDLTRHDLMLFPSAEAAGLAWVEALACGTPVVAFDGATEVAAAASQVCGITLAPISEDRARNVLAFANAIQTAFGLRLDRALIAEKALQRYGWRRFAAEVQTAYRRAMQVSIACEDVRS
jgi:glycosyltransferase involved in cell wall biosynthesis